MIVVFDIDGTLTSLAPVRSSCSLTNSDRADRIFPTST
jgi:hypothetical protein